MEQWHQTARRAQLPPNGDWAIWYLCGGRGSGKTRAGSENFADLVLEREHDPGGEWGVVAPTWDKDARAVCVEGPSGLLKTLGPAVRDWNRSSGELFLHSGAKVYITSADDGARHIQGKDLRGLWAEEIGLWSNWQMAWDESIAFAVRQDPAKIIVTGTPKKGHPLVRRLLSDSLVAVTRMRTLDNAANLNPASLQAMIDRYAGTLLGRQELDGELIDDVSGALWQRSDILYCRGREFQEPPAPLDLTRIVVGVDPSGAKDSESGNNAIGIVVCGFDKYTQYGYVLADYSLTDGPEKWAAAVRSAYHMHKADLIVAEPNFGGEMVRSTIHAADRTLPVKLVHSSRGKEQRAEPVSMLYKGGRIYHDHPMPELDDQLCTWIPGENKKESPDRLDAMVFALTELMLTSTEAKVISGKRYGEEPVYRKGDLVLTGDIYIDKERTW